MNNKYVMTGVIVLVVLALVYRIPQVRTIVLGA